jgi:hypothetical protein
MEDRIGQGVAELQSTTQAVGDDRLGILFSDLFQKGAADGRRDPSVARPERYAAGAVVGAQGLTLSPHTTRM